MADTVPTWVAAGGVIVVAVLTFAGTVFTRTTRTPAEQDAKDLSMLTTALKENRELRIENGDLRGQFEKIWEELADCQKQHRECEHRQDKADRRAERQQEQLEKLLKEVETLKQAA